MKMHWCTCRVNLAGQGFHVVVFEPADPVSWPEAQVLMAVHGDENVMDIMPISVAEIEPVREKERLIAKYGYPVVEQVFPGRTFRMQLMLGDDATLPTSNDQGVVEPSVEEEAGTAGPQEPPMTTPVMKPGRFGRPAPQPSGG